MSGVVLDASAMLAFLHGEPGGDIVDGYLGGAAASAVNVAEVGARLSDLGASLAEVRRAIGLLAVEVVAFDAEQGYAAAGIRSATRSRGLSLGDRACLQLAARRGLPAVTADQAWAELDVGAEVLLIRT